MLAKIAELWAVLIGISLAEVRGINDVSSDTQPISITRGFRSATKHEYNLARHERRMRYGTGLGALVSLVRHSRTVASRPWLVCTITSQ